MAAIFWNLCPLHIPVTISITKGVNTCWLPNLIWWRNPVSKMKSCNRSCSQRACTASGSGMKSCSGSCSQRERTAYRSIFSLFELSCQTSERHFAVIYVGMPWVTQKRNYSQLLRVMLGLSNLLHADLQIICGSWLTIFWTHIAGSLLSSALHFVAKTRVHKHFVEPIASPSRWAPEKSKNIF